MVSLEGPTDVPFVRDNAVFFFTCAPVTMTMSTPRKGTPRSALDESVGQDNTRKRRTRQDTSFLSCHIPHPDSPAILPVPHPHSTCSPVCTSAQTPSGDGTPPPLPALGPPIAGRAIEPSPRQSGREQARRRQHPETLASSATTAHLMVLMQPARPRQPSRRALLNPPGSSRREAAPLVRPRVRGGVGRPVSMRKAC